MYATHAYGYAYGCNRDIEWSTTSLLELHLACSYTPKACFLAKFEPWQADQAAKQLQSVLKSKSLVNLSTKFVIIADFDDVYALLQY